MTFQEISRLAGMQCDAYAEIGMKKALFVKNENGHMSVELNEDAVYSLSGKCAGIMLEAAHRPFITKLEVMLWCEVFSNGPKVFRPTSFQLEKLEEMVLNVESQDFHMPYETIVIELPKEYREARAITGFTPELSIFHHEKRTRIMVHSVTNGVYALKGWWAPTPTDELESWFDKEDYQSKTTELPFSDQEAQIEYKIRRAITNYILLLDEVGIRECGPASPGEYAQLVKWCQKRNEHTPRNKLRLSQQGMVYDLKKPDIELVRIVTSEGDLPDHHKTDRKLRPHSRRGFYKMQPCGPKNSERKRIRIPSTIVNKHLLVGTLPPTGYKT
jgi:hypothetical protein